MFRIHFVLRLTNERRILSNTMACRSHPLSLRDSSKAIPSSPTLASLVYLWTMVRSHGHLYPLFRQPRTRSRKPTLSRSSKSTLKTRFRITRSSEAGCASWTASREAQLERFFAGNCGRWIKWINLDCKSRYVCTSIWLLIGQRPVNQKRCFTFFCCADWYHAIFVLSLYNRPPQMFQCEMKKKTIIHQAAPVCEWKFVAV